MMKRKSQNELRALHKNYKIGAWKGETLDTNKKDCFENKNRLISVSSEPILTRKHEQRIKIKESDT